MNLNCGRYDMLAMQLNDSAVDTFVVCNVVTRPVNILKLIMCVLMYKQCWKSY